MKSASVTRGHGLLESYLARKRCRMANALVPPVAREGCVIDVGCGSYPQFLMLSAFREKYGVDKLVRDADRAALRDHGIELRNVDLETDTRLPFADDFADAVTMLAVFEHLAPQRLVPLVREVHRVLKPGGVYVLTTPAHWTAGLLRTLARLRLVSPEEIGEHKDAYDHRRIVTVLTAAGFDAAGIRCGTFEWGMNLWVAATKR